MPRSGSEDREHGNDHSGLGQNDFDSSVKSLGQIETTANLSPTQTVPWRELRYFGSVADCYLLFGHGERASGSRLLVVDQHAFHERIIYERLVLDQNLLKSSQALLVPECVHLGPKATATIKEMLPVLTSNGFALDVLDDSNVEVRAVPVLLAKSDITTLLETITEQSEKLPMHDNVGLLHDHLATFACHAAVRAGEAIGPDELKILLKEADNVDFYHNCPHGRRVIRWWEESQIGRWFDR
jgi:DNA mismatch repair protein MutL